MGEDYIPHNREITRDVRLFEKSLPQDENDSKLDDLVITVTDSTQNTRPKTPQVIYSPPAPPSMARTSGTRIFYRRKVSADSKPYGGNIKTSALTAFLNPKGEEF
ncbi:unnamed protein product [Allacma fusca]|uniref:Uncharacterized protein n=1 Tax=Allacma fusca TaxID=39272 RepID=A0A8J2L7H9_9HEXA|nr:unnamed protein product [Allacma fusca]